MLSKLYLSEEPTGPVGEIAEYLREQLQKVNARIDRLEKIYDAAILAQQTLEEARAAGRASV